MVEHSGIANLYRMTDKQWLCSSLDVRMTPKQTSTVTWRELIHKPRISENRPFWIRRSVYYPKLCKLLGVVDMRNMYVICNIELARLESQVEAHGVLAIRPALLSALPLGPSLVQRTVCHTLDVVHRNETYMEREKSRILPSLLRLQLRRALVECRSKKSARSIHRVSRCPR